MKKALLIIISGLFFSFSMAAEGTIFFADLRQRYEIDISQYEDHPRDRELISY
ncbi:MAG: hypothetical protein HQ510_00825 [Candidatus Marinimicrobia bacterium]|nr:hypothetical protein [Candidatus Neomarinimicrobiota bacterium]